MLKPVFDRSAPPSVTIDRAAFPAPFDPGLEYAAPARGTWNIVHIGMLIPQAHEIFVCAEGCLRGVVLTAAEMGASERFSTVAIREQNMLDGDMETLIIEGVSDILGQLPSLPPAVLVYTSCIHHFMGCDLPLVYRVLRERFPMVDFTDCYMNPIMRKSGLTPDQLMRRQLYSLLKPQPLEPRAVNIIGNCFATDERSDLVRCLRAGGWQVRDIAWCRSYAEYQQMARSSVNISYNPVARAGGEALAEHLGQRHLYLPLSYDPREIAGHMDALCETLELPRQDDGPLMEGAERALAAARRVIGQTPIAIDYTATTRPLGLAKLLIEHGFAVSRVYADSFLAEERSAFDWLQAHAPGLTLQPTVQVGMRVAPRDAGVTLAIGQKAAYFTGTRHFVNIVEGGGLYGLDGIRRMAELMVEAHLHEKDARSLIQIKGLGCRCCV